MGLTDKHLAYGDDIPQTQAEKDHYWELKDLKEKARKYDELKEAMKKIRGEVEQLPTKTRTNWDGCCPDIDYPEIEYFTLYNKYCSKFL